MAVKKDNKFTKGSDEWTESVELCKHLLVNDRIDDYVYVESVYNHMLKNDEILESQLVALRKYKEKYPEVVNRPWRGKFR